jgi:uncharacterized protein
MESAVSAKQVLAAVVLSVVGIATADAASFDCTKVQSATEKAICTNSQLDALDDQTAGMYFEIVGAAPPPAMLSQVKASQSLFLGKRNACGANVDCLVDAYTSQIMFLKDIREELGL